MKYSIFCKKITALLLLFACISGIDGQQPFKPVPDNLTDLYKFNLKRNFFSTEGDFNLFLNKFGRNLKAFEEKLNQKPTVLSLVTLTQNLSRLEYDFRKMDLYLFLQYATNTTNVKAAILEDSLYDVMAKHRNSYKTYIKSTPPNTIKDLLRQPSMDSFQYYVINIVSDKKHELSQADNALLKPFSYLKNSHFYDVLVNEIPTDSIITTTGTLDLFKNMADWENHPDSLVRADGERKLYKSYNTVKTPLGYQYIQLIMGLNAFSRSKNYESLIDETCNKVFLPKATLENIFGEIEASASLNKEYMGSKLKEERRYNVTAATEILLNSFGQLGSQYHVQASQLLDPVNGRLDIVGGENRMGMQGVASVYPVGVSVFYANNYEGYYIDLMLLSHETGHAIQASLMSENKVSLLNASGPGYFTESFGKFNELLVSYYLYENSKTTTEKDFYFSKYTERLLGLFGSAAEAAIEYNLIQGIISDKITRPDELDSITFLTGGKYRDFRNSPEQKGLWMRLETNFKAPLHNINDMIASLLALHYFQQFLADRDSFSIKYNKFLRNGYTDNPSALLEKYMGIKLNDKDFCSDAILFLKSELLKYK